MPRGKERPQPEPSAGYRRSRPKAPVAPKRSGLHALLYLSAAALALLLLFGWTRGALIPSTCLFHPSAP